MRDDGGAMKISFPLHVPGKHDDRVRDKIRHEVNKHVRRVTQKPLPKGMGRWDLQCKVGATPADAETRLPKEIGAAIDAVARTGADGVYIEIVAVALPRSTPAPVAGAPESAETDSEI